MQRIKALTVCLFVLAGCRSSWEGWNEPDPDEQEDLGERLVEAGDDAVAAGKYWRAASHYRDALSERPGAAATETAKKATRWVLRAKLEQGRERVADGDFRAAARLYAALYTDSVVAPIRAELAAELAGFRDHLWRVGLARAAELHHYIAGLEALDHLERHGKVDAATEADYARLAAAFRREGALFHTARIQLADGFPRAQYLHRSAAARLSGTSLRTPRHSPKVKVEVQKRGTCSSWAVPSLARDRVLRLEGPTRGGQTTIMITFDKCYRGGGGRMEIVYTPMPGWVTKPTYAWTTQYDEVAVPNWTLDMGQTSRCVSTRGGRCTTWSTGPSRARASGTSTVRVPNRVRVQVGSERVRGTTYVSSQVPVTRGFGANGTIVFRYPGGRTETLPFSSHGNDKDQLASAVAARIRGAYRAPAAPDLHAFASGRVDPKHPFNDEERVLKHASMTVRAMGGPGRRNAEIRKLVANNAFWQRYAMNWREIRDLMDHDVTPLGATWLLDLKPPRQGT